MAKMILNPNKEFRYEVIKRMKANDGYCPCAIIKNEDTKCKCKAMRENNYCHCGLYIEKVEE